MIPFLPGYFYYVTLALQAICVIHCLRRGNQQRWIYIIVFLPLIGCIAYFFTEIITPGRMQNLQSGVGGVFNSAGRIRRLESNLQVSHTFNNRVMLADAYLAAGRTDEAIELYTGSLTGAFEENEHVLKQLIVAYFQKEQYADVIRVAKQLYNRPQFARSKEHVLYAQSLAKMGETEKAEQEFMKMKARFANFEARYQYGIFLAGLGRENEARLTFSAIVDEAGHLSSRERRDSGVWISKAREEMKKK